MSEPTNTFDYPSRADFRVTREWVDMNRKLNGATPYVTLPDHIHGQLLAAASEHLTLRPIAAALVAAWVDYCDADDNGWTERREQLADHIDGLMGQLREVIA